MCLCGFVLLLASKQQIYCKSYNKHTSPKIRGPQARNPLAVVFNPLFYSLWVCSKVKRGPVQCSPFPNPGVHSTFEILFLTSTECTGLEDSDRKGDE